MTILPWSFLHAQDHCVEGRFDNYLFAEEETEVITGIIYGQAPDLMGELRNLVLNLYRPLPELDDYGAKPILIFIHGGGLKGGSKTNPGPSLFGERLSRMGWLVASIDYRLGWDELGTCEGDTASLQEARYRADQDARAAVRFLKEMAGEYEVDTNAMFAAGFSVGATVALHTAFAEQDDYNPYLMDLLGALDSSGNEHYDHSVDIRGVLAKSAGTDRPLIVQRRDIPVHFFHGTCDYVVPYIQSPLFGCWSPVKYMQYYGARYLTDRMAEVGHDYHFYSNERGDHTGEGDDTMLTYSIPFLKDILVHAGCSHGNVLLFSFCICKTEVDEFSVGFLDQFQCICG